jgi:hypothetical protein
MMSIEHGQRQAGMRSAADSLEIVRVRVLPDGRLTRRDAAKYLGVAEKTLAMWALEGRGPKSLKVGGRRFYFQKTLDCFVQGVPGE